MIQSLYTSLRDYLFSSSPIPHTKMEKGKNIRLQYYNPDTENISQITAEIEAIPSRNRYLLNTDEKRILLDRFENDGKRYTYSVIKEPYAFVIENIVEEELASPSLNTHDSVGTVINISILES